MRRSAWCCWMGPHGFSRDGGVDAAELLEAGLSETGLGASVHGRACKSRHAGTPAGIGYRDR